MARPLNIDYDKLWPTKNDGYVQILEDLGMPEGGGNRNVRIRFLDTGNEQVVQLANVKNANVRDRAKRDIIGQRFTSNNYGDFIVIEKLGTLGGTNSMHKIRFVDTGYECNASTTNIMIGNVKDPFCKSVYGIGYIGNTKNPGNYYEYHIWCDMLKRVNGNESRYASYKNVKIDPEWLNFENFLRDIVYVPGYNEYIKLKQSRMHSALDRGREEFGYALDKDLLQLCIKPGMEKVYSRDTCCFLPFSDNSTLPSDGHTHIAHQAPQCIYEMNGVYYVRPIINNQVWNFGEYLSYEAAVNAFNYRCQMYGLTGYMIPDVPVMSREDVSSYNNTALPMIRPVNNN